MSLTYKTDRYDITEILLKVGLNNITPHLLECTQFCYCVSPHLLINTHVFHVCLHYKCGPDRTDLWVPTNTHNFTIVLLEVVNTLMIQLQLLYVQLRLRLC